MIPILNFPNYLITESGMVWSKRREGTKGGWVTSRPDKDGYLIIDLWKTKVFCKKIHRLLLETFVGPCPEGMECRHLNGDRQDNRLENLKWGTHAENVRDTVRQGNHPKTMLGKHGEKSPVSKLSNLQRRLVIYQYSTGLQTQYQLAEEYGVHQSTIGRLVTGKIWPFAKAVRVAG